MGFSKAQEEFVYHPDPFPAFVGGFGSGKTAAGIARLMRLKRLCPQQDVAYYLPTYPLVKDIAFQRFPELFERHGIPYSLNRQDAVLTFNLGRIIFRNMEQPDRIVGYEVAHSIVDELDTLSMEKATNAWNKIIARNRQKAFTIAGRPVPNTVGVVTTPEGFRFTYERWEKENRPGYALVRAKTSDNAAHLPADYIQNLKDSYPEALLLAYLEGQFVNLTTGTIYYPFDRERHHTDEVIEDGEALHIGMDFNVGKMAAVVCVKRNQKPRALAEFANLYDTPEMIASIKERFPGHSVMVYPDSSGGARKTVNASATDISLLRAAGFTVLANTTNPAVKDRIMAVNLQLEKDELLVNTDLCPVLTESLERQPYSKSGKPDKEGGFDHPNDALGYFITYAFGATRSTVTLHQLSGI